MMVKYGIENVRGGCYFQTELSNDVIDALPLTSNILGLSEREIFEWTYINYCHFHCTLYQVILLILLSQL